MRRIETSLNSLAAAFLIFSICACSSQPKQIANASSDAANELLLDGEKEKSNVTAEPAKSEAPIPSVISAVPPCSVYGSKNNFNDQRIVAFQKLVQLQILRIKSLQMTEESTEALSQLEILRRRVSYPLLTSALRPSVVSKTLFREAQVFVALLDKRKNIDSQAQSLLDEVINRFIPLIDNQDQWNCVERQTDFSEDGKPEGQTPAPLKE